MGGHAAITVLLLLALGLGACGQSSQAKPERRENGSRPPGRALDRPAVRITTAVVEARAVQRSVETVGSLLAWEEVAAADGPSS